MRAITETAMQVYGIRGVEPLSATATTTTTEVRHLQRAHQQAEDQVSQARTIRRGLGLLGSTIGLYALKETVLGSLKKDMTRETKGLTLLATAGVVLIQATLQSDSVTQAKERLNLIRQAEKDPKGFAKSRIVFGEE